MILKKSVRECWDELLNEQGSLQKICEIMMDDCQQVVLRICHRVPVNGDLTDGSRMLTIPRHNPIHAVTMGNIVRDAGLTNEEFRKRL